METDWLYHQAPNTLPCLSFRKEGQAYNPWTKKSCHHARTFFFEFNQSQTRNIHDQNCSFYAFVWLHCWKFGAECPVLMEFPNGRSAKLRSSASRRIFLKLVSELYEDVKKIETCQKRFPLNFRKVSLQKEKDVIVSHLPQSSRQLYQKPLSSASKMLRAADGFLTTVAFQMWENPNT